MTGRSSPSADDPTSPGADTRPAPLDPPTLPFALGGTALWALVGVVLLPFRGRLQAAGHGSWLWICLAGVLIGFVGIAVMYRYDANRRRRAEGSPAEE